MLIILYCDCQRTWQEWSQAQIQTAEFLSRTTCCIAGVSQIIGPIRRPPLPLRTPKAPTLPGLQEEGREEEKASAKEGRGRKVDLRVPSGLVYERD